MFKYIQYTYEKALDSPLISSQLAVQNGTKGFTGTFSTKR